MFGTKRTKQNIRRTGQLSVNLVSTDMLPLVDNFGSSAFKNSGKMEVAHTPSAYVHAPILDQSRWVYECEVAQTVQTGAPDTFFCRIKNIQIDECIEVDDTFHIHLVPFDPVIYSGIYHSLGRHLGEIGDFYSDPASKDGLGKYNLKKICENRKITLDKDGGIEYNI